MTEAWHNFPSPGLVTQADGSPFQWLNCAPATWAALTVSQQQGKRPGKGSPWYPTGASLRTQSGDRSGGIMPSTLDATVNRVYGIDLVVRIATVAAVEEALRDGLAVGILHDYSAISAAGMSGSPGFLGAHSSPLFGTRELPSGGVQWLDGDPLYNGRRAGIPKGPKWIDRNVLIRAAGDLELNGPGSITFRQRYGTGMLYAVFTTNPYNPPGRIVEAQDVSTSSAERNNRMIRGMWGVSSAKVQTLQPKQPVYAYPGGPRVTRISSTRPVSVSFLGKAGPSWGSVIVRTGAPYSDGVPRPTGVYVPLAAGPVRNR